MRANKYNKESYKRQKYDRMRSLRVVKYLEYPFILSKSPVELEEGFIVSDKETYDIFASFIFKNVSDRPIRKLNIRLSCYLNQIIPYAHIDFTYCAEDLTFGIIGKNGTDLRLRESNAKASVDNSETFGSCVYIPLPESYFSKLDLTLVSVEYAGGTVEELDILVAGDSKKYNELDNYSKLAYHRINIYKTAEADYPTKVIPQFGENGWLCCCGTKNAVTSVVCEKCHREREWQEKSVTVGLIEETKNRLINDPTEVAFHDKSKFKQNKHLVSKDEEAAKIEQYEKAMKNIALEEKRRQRRQMMLIPKILLVVLIAYLIMFLFKLIDTLKPAVNSDGASASSQATTENKAEDNAESVETAYVFHTDITRF